MGKVVIEQKSKISSPTTTPAAEKSRVNTEFFSKFISGAGLAPPAIEPIAINTPVIFEKK